jgi:hypothetical protein
MNRRNALDTRFRTALERIAEAGQLLTYSDPVDTSMTGSSATRSPPVSARSRTSTW